MRRGRRARHLLVLLVALERREDRSTDRIEDVAHGAPPSRIGFAVGRQVGKAVVRNRVKRRLRAIVAALAWKTGFDLVVVARPEAAAASYEELRAAVSKNAAKMGLLQDASR